MIKEWGKRVLFGGGLATFLPSIASAHEVYVLEKDVFSKALTAPTINLLSSFNNPQNIWLVLAIAIVTLVALTGLIVFSRTKLSQEIDDKLIKKADLGRFVLRLALATALFAGAQSGHIFGPELSVTDLPAGQLIHYLLYGLSILTLLGWLTELAALALVVIYGFIVYTYGFYGFTYLSYFGEIFTLMLFGAGFYSIDRHFAKAEPRHTSHVTDLEALIIRIGYGLALIYAAVMIKFLHPAIPLEVVNLYELTTFRWLFPPDPTLVVLGAGIVELCIGLAIVFGFQIRAVVLFSLFHLTLSLFFFGESVWPHIIMYGISFYLIITNGGRLLKADDLFLPRKSGKNKQ